MSHPTLPLLDRVAVVTGAARGLGAAIATAFEAAGATVVRVDLAGPGCFTADIATAEGNADLVAHTLELHGRIDSLVLNAGVQHVAPLGAFPEAEWDRLEGVMLKGPFLGLRAAWQELVQSGGSATVVASANAFLAEPGKVAYNAAKAGTLGLIRTAALEGAPVGVRVNGIAPGWMRTPMAEGQLDELASQPGMDRLRAAAQLLARQPSGRFVELEEVAAVAVFLATDAAVGINGACIPVDHGYVAG